MNAEIISAGPMMTIQDSGRVGFSAEGIPPSGALDGFAAEIINRLLGNSPGCAVIESIMLGGSVRFDGDAVFALGGADMGAKLNGEPCRLYRAYRAESGNVLELGFARNGCCGYLAVSGGFDVEPVMGSRSTNVRCGFGGYCGRPLKAGDIIKIGIPYGKISELKINPEDFCGDEIRVVKGAQFDLFSEEDRRIFFGGEYTVTQSYDRMGCRLCGEPLKASGGTDIISEAVGLGAIQISSDGQPIIMLADRQTVGGYAKIASVIAADIHSFVRHRPGDKIRFKLVSAAKARSLYKKQRRILEHCREKEYEI